MTDLRIAICGCGFIADMHARAVRAAGGARVVGVANHRLETAPAFAERHGIEQVTTDWATLVTAPASTPSSSRRRTRSTPRRRSPRSPPASTCWSTSRWR